MKTLFSDINIGKALFAISIFLGFVGIFTSHVALLLTSAAWAITLLKCHFLIDSLADRENLIKLLRVEIDNNWLTIRTLRSSKTAKG